MVSSNKRAAAIKASKKIKNEIKVDKTKEENEKIEENKDIELEYFKDIAESEEESENEESDNSSEEENDNEKKDEKDEKDEFQKGEKVIALNPEDEEKLKKKIEKINTEKDNKIKTGVIFLSRIPHGFYEKQMQAYFSQFGEITRLRLSRNKKTGKSKHYAFIEFKNEQVAKIVAETMDNYILYGHVLKCNVIPEDQVHPDTFNGANKKFKVIPWAKIERKRQQQPKSGKAYKKNIKHLIAKDEKKRKRLRELGIDYEFEGYAANVKKEAKHIKYE